jgi:type IV secretory pathway VirB10-like protein
VFDLKIKYYNIVYMVGQNKSKASKTQVQEPVIAKVETPVQEHVNETPVQKAGGKKAPAKKVQAKKAEPVEKPVEQPVEAAPKKAVAKKTAAKKTVAKKEPVAKKAVEKKTAAKKEKEPVKETEADGEAVDEDDKTRSFKVKLPNEEEFTGRFTGLTPYQAANKALSKYFRNSENSNISDSQVTFSIKESTRGSKRSVYTYKGSRVKLEKAITYTIKSLSGEERVITKQYKNQLIKVKKGVAPSEAPVANA